MRYVIIFITIFQELLCSIRMGQPGFAALKGNTSARGSCSRVLSATASGRITKKVGERASSGLESERRVTTLRSGGGVEDRPVCWSAAGVALHGSCGMCRWRLTLIGPVIVNILLFHVLMNPGGIVPGLIAAISWLMVFYSVRPAFQGIFRDVRTNTGMAKGDENRREQILAA